MVFSWLRRCCRRCRHSKLAETTEVSEGGKAVPLSASSLLSKPRCLECSNKVNDVALTPNGIFFCLALDSLPVYRCITSEPHPMHNAVPIYQYSNFGLRSRYAGHSQSVTACTLSADGAFCASADFSGETRVWRADTARHLLRFAGHSSAVSDLDFTPAGDILVSAGRDSTVIMWDVSTEARRRTFTGHCRPVSACAIDMDGNCVLTAGQDGILFLWDTRQNPPVATITPHKRRAVTHCAPDRLWRKLVTTGFDRRVGLWDTRMYKLIFDAEVDGSIMYGCDISGDGSRFVACGEHGNLRIWNSSNQKDVDSLSGHDVDMNVSRCAINNDATRVVSVSHDKTARFFDLVPLPTDSEALCIPTGNSAVSALHEQYMNHGEQLTASKLKNALVSDYSRGALHGFSDVFLAHVMIKTALKSGILFDCLFDGVEDRNTFFHKTAYHKLAEMMRTEAEKEFGLTLLMDAKKNGLLHISDVRHIMGDAQVLDVVDSMAAGFRSLLAEVCTHVQNRLDSMEKRLHRVSVDLQSVSEDLQRIGADTDRRAKIRRWATLVNLGISLVPIAGSIATGIVDASAQIFLSFDISSVVQILSISCANLAQAGVHLYANQAGGDSYANGSGSERTRREEIEAVRLVQLLTSSELLKRIPKYDSDAIRNAILTNYGADSDELFRNISMIIEEHESLENLTEPNASEET